MRLHGVHVHMQNVIVSRRRRRPRPPRGIGRQMPKSIFGVLNRNVLEETDSTLHCTRWHYRFINIVTIVSVELAQFSSRAPEIGGSPPVVATACPARNQSANLKTIPSKLFFKGDLKYSLASLRIQYGSMFIDEGGFGILF